MTAPRRRYQRRQWRWGAKTPTKLSPSHHPMLYVTIWGRGRMSFTAVYPRDTSWPCKNAVIDRKRGNDTVGNGKGKDKYPWKIVGSCVEALTFHIIARQEFSRRFGSEKKTRKFKGVVIQSYLLKNGYKARHNLCSSRVWPGYFREKEEEERSYSLNG